jgi:hypothetical protein
MGKAKAMWQIFGKACRRCKRSPSAKEVARLVQRIDGVYFLPPSYL